MSNEYKDWCNDLWEVFNQEASALDDLPMGWTMTFIGDLKYDLFETLGSYADDWIIADAKEKYGELRLYWAFRDRDYTEQEQDDLNALYDEIEEVIEHYRQISTVTCAICGALSDSCKIGWGMPLCKDCNGM